MIDAFPKGASQGRVAQVRQAALSQTIAGAIVHHFGFDAGFLFLAAIAAAALTVLYLFMPETADRNLRNGNV